MAITSGRPIFSQLSGISEGAPVSLEVLIGWEQQLDTGDAKIVPIEEFPIENRGDPNHMHTHRLFSVTGGVFHVTVDEKGDREQVDLELPQDLKTIVRMGIALEGIRRQIGRLVSVNRILQGELTIANATIAELRKKGGVLSL